MAILNTKKRRPKLTPEVVTTYDSFRKGLNTFLLDSELTSEESVELTNLRLVGKGILEPRSGVGSFHLANAGQTVNFITDFYLNGTLEVLSIGNDGFLTKKSGASYTRILGASFASGARPEGAQIYGKMYLVDGTHPLTRYDGTTLLSYTQISRPTSLLATKSTGATGAFQFSYRVSASTSVGETLASDPVTLSVLPETLTTTAYVTLSWTAASPASSVRSYNVYGRERGAESFVTSVPPSVTSWIDDGSNPASLTIFPPDSDTTLGPIAEHIRTHKEKLLLGNLSFDDSMFMWSGSGPFIDKFDYSKGGGFYSIEKQSKDRFGITGLSEKEGNAIVFKGQSIYQATITYNSTYGVNEARVQKIVDGVGAISSRTIQEVENSIMFVGYIQGRGLALAKLDYEPNILSSVLRFQPISARVQSIIDQVNMARISESWSLYYGKVYYWFLPIGTSSWTCLPYDVERLAFTGPFTLTNAWSGSVHLDATNDYHMLLGKSDGNVVEFSDEFSSDEGTDFEWTYLSKKEDFKKPLQLKTAVDSKVKLRNVSSGTVNISYIMEGPDGLSDTVETVDITPVATLAGWGSRRYGYNARYGYMPSTSETNSNTQVVYSLLNANNIISEQVRITGTGSRAQILSIEMAAREMSRKLIPSEWRSS